MGVDDSAKDKNAKKFGGLALCAATQGACYAGFQTGGLPFIYTHLSGEKLFACIDLEELLDCYTSDKTCKTTDLTPEHPDLPTLQAGGLIVGSVP